MKKELSKKDMSALWTSVLAPALLTVQASAGIADSEIGTGLKTLISDASTYVTILCPLTGALAAGYFAIRRSMADEQDGKMWEKRIRTSIFCGVGGGLASLVIALLASYF